MTDKELIEEAIKLSGESIDLGGFPVGCILAVNGEIVARGLSNGKKLVDPTSHAEIAAIRDLAKKREDRFLVDVTLYSSCEPCLMCFCACKWARIPKVVYACSRAKVPQNYFEGNHNLQKINEKMQNPIRIEFFKDLENEALEIIQTFEKQNT